MEMVTVPKKEYEELKKKAKIEEGLLQELVEGLKDVKSGNVKRVK